MVGHLKDATYYWVRVRKVKGSHHGALVGTGAGRHQGARSRPLQPRPRQRRPATRYDEVALVDQRRVHRLLPDHHGPDAVRLLPHPARGPAQRDVHGVRRPALGDAHAGADGRGRRGSGLGSPPVLPDRRGPSGQRRLRKPSLPVPHAYRRRRGALDRQRHQAPVRRLQHARPGQGPPRSSLEEAPAPDREEHREGEPRRGGPRGAACRACGTTTTAGSASTRRCARPARAGTS